MNNYPNHFSSHSISTYNSCPRKYKLQFINKANRNKTIVNKYFSFDKSLHSILAKINSLTPNQVNRLNIHKLNFLIEKDWISLGYNDTMEELHFKQRALKTLLEYTSLPKDTGIDTLLINKILRSNLDKHIRICGKIDKVYETDNGDIEIVDYKTGSVINKSANFYTNIQLPLYLLLVYEELGILAESISYYYLSYNYKITYRVTKEDTENAYSILHEHLTNIKKDSTFSCSPTPYCKDSCIFYSKCKINNSTFR